MRSQKRLLTALFFSAVCASLLSCTKPDDPFDFRAQLDKEIKAIDDYLAANSLNAIKDPRGVRMVVTKPGTKLPAQYTQTVDVDYTGTLFADKTEFDKGNLQLPLTNLIEGWTIAFTQLPAGSEAKLFIPSYYGYSNMGRGSIPKNATLIFDVKFNKVVYSSFYLQKLAADTNAIDNYLTEKAIAATKDTTGIRYMITTPGSGATPGLYDKLKLSYAIKFLSDDTKTVASFDLEPRPNDYFDSRAVDYLQGMMIGLMKMKAGAKATLYIPSGLAFGANGYTSSQVVVPPNTNLIVDVELKEVL